MGLWQWAVTTHAWWQRSCREWTPQPWWPTACFHGSIGIYAIYYSWCQPVQFIPCGREGGRATHILYQEDCLTPTSPYTTRIVNTDTTMSLWYQSWAVLACWLLQSILLHQYCINAGTAYWTWWATSAFCRKKLGEGKKKALPDRFCGMGPGDQHCGGTTIVWSEEPQYGILEFTVSIALSTMLMQQWYPSRGSVVSQFGSVTI